MNSTEQSVFLEEIRDPWIGDFNFQTEREEVKEIEQHNDHSYCKKSEISEIPRHLSNNQNRSEYLRCGFCFQRRKRDSLKLAADREERLIIIVSGVLQGILNVIDAKSYLARTIFYNCYPHSAEAVQNIKIYSSLESNRLMSVVNGICPDVMTISQFNSILYRWKMRNLEQDQGVEKDFPPEFMEITKMDSLESSKPTSTYHLCIYCSQLKPSRLLKSLRTREDKLMIILLVYRLYTLEQRQSYINRKSSIHICHEHFQIILVDAYQMLRFPPDQFLGVMENVNELAEEINLEQFLTIFRVFLIKHKHFISDVNIRNQISAQQHRMVQCLVCRMLPGLDEANLLTTNNGKPQFLTKLITVIGCVLNGKMTIEKAKSLFSVEKKNQFICFSHYEESLKRVLRALEVDTCQEITGCSMELFEELMSLVHKFCPKVSMPVFRIMLANA